MNNIFEKNLRTLKDISIDNHDPSNPEYMTESDEMAVDFDRVKEDYVYEKDLYYHPKSADALVDRDGQLTMIEFKNGTVDRDLVRDIKEKMLASALIYSDITGRDLEFIRSRMDFILVYNYNKNPFKANQVSNSFYKDQLKRGIFKKAKLRYRQFGLDQYEGFVYKNVYTYSMRDFRQEFTGDHNKYDD